MIHFSYTCIRKRRIGLKTRMKPLPRLLLQTLSKTTFCAVLSASKRGGAVSNFRMNWRYTAERHRPLIGSWVAASTNSTSMTPYTPLPLRRVHFVSARVCVSADNNNIALFGEVGGEELYCKAATVPDIGQITVPHSMIYMFQGR